MQLIVFNKVIKCCTLTCNNIYWSFSLPQIIQF